VNTFNKSTERQKFKTYHPAFLIGKKNIISLTNYVYINPKTNPEKERYDRDMCSKKIVY
jgi:poly-D-alanine transfer protein DltD